MKQARETLQRSLAQIEQTLGSTLLSRPDGPGGAMQEALALCETDVRKRHSEVGKLRESIGELRRTVEHYESAAWLNAVQGED